MLNSHGKEAYDLIFERFYRFVYQRAFFILKNEDETADLVQSFFIDLWEKQKYGELRNDMEGYLYTSIRNRALNHLRNKESEKRRHELFLLTAHQDPESDDRYEEYFLILNEALRNLPLQRRQAIQMVYLKDHKYRDAAREMGISINTLKTHLKVGLKYLRRSCNR